MLRFSDHNQDALLILLENKGATDPLSFPATSSISLK